jgi:hypothetical protein
MVAVLAMAAVSLLAATGCEMRVDVVVDVASGGAGTVAVAVSFDDAALARLGDPVEALALDDLVAVGWTLEPIARQDDGTTQVRMVRAFDDPDGFAAVLDEIAGAGGPLAGSRVTVDQGWINTTTDLVGVVDLSAGLAPFADPELTAATGGVPFAGLVEQVEAEQGRPVADLVPVTVTWIVGDESAVVTPRLGDPAVTVALSQRDRPLQWMVVPLALLGVVAAVGFVVAVTQRRRGSSGAPDAVPDAGSDAGPDTGPDAGPPDRQGDPGT